MSSAHARFTLVRFCGNRPAKTIIENPIDCIDDGNCVGVGFNAREKHLWKIITAEHPRKVAPQTLEIPLPTPTHHQKKKKTPTQ